MCEVFIGYGGERNNDDKTPFSGISPVRYRRERMSGGPRGLVLEEALNAR